MQSAWVAACDVNNLNIKSSFICEKHFTEDSYKQDLVNELLDRPVQKLLKWDAIPTINVPFVVTAIKPISTESVDQGNLLMVIDNKTVWRKGFSLLSNMQFISKQN